MGVGKGDMEELKGADKNAQISRNQCEKEMGQFKLSLSCIGTPKMKCPVIIPSCKCVSSFQGSFFMVYLHLHWAELV